MFGDHQKQSFTADELSTFFSSKGVMFWLCAVWVVFALMVWAMKLPWFRRMVAEHKSTRVGPLSHGLIAGITGAQQFLWLKAGVQIIKHATDRKQDPMTHWQLYVFSSFAIISAGLQFRFLNEGLALYDNVIFLPMYNAWLIMFGVANGAIVYGEFSKLAEEGFIYFFLGVFLCNVGIMMLTVRVPGMEYSEDDAALQNDKDSESQSTDKVDETTKLLQPVAAIPASADEEVLNPKGPAVDEEAALTGGGDADPDSSSVASEEATNSASGALGQGRRYRRGGN